MSASNAPSGQDDSAGQEEELSVEEESPRRDIEAERSFASDQQFPASFTQIDRQYAARRDVPRRIHILGTGNVGKFIAHSLKGIANPPPVTLMFHRHAILQAWEESKKQIVVQDGGFQVPRDGYDVELVMPLRREHGVELEDGMPSVYDFPEEIRPHEAARIVASSRRDAPPQIESDAEEEQRRMPGADAVSNEPIHNLIVSTKAPRTVAALSAIKHRISANTSICFLQNGLGIIEEVNKLVFPDPETRPNYMQGIITHGVNVPSSAGIGFSVIHAGYGTIALGLLPRSKIKQTTITSSEGQVKEIEDKLWAPTSRYLLRTITRTPVLCAVGFAPTELLQQQLEKLAINAIINPLTVLLDARNGALLYNFALTRTMRLMLAEISLVLRSLPELQGLPNVKMRFSPERLETLVVAIADKTRDNVSSMLADVRGGRRTEIKYINGYFVTRGEEIGIKCVVNYAIMQTVIGKSMMVQRESQDELPVERRVDE